MSFPHRLKYGGNYKICILPIVQKTAEKKKHSQFSMIFKILHENEGILQQDLYQ